MTARRQPVRVVELTHEERMLIRRLLRLHAAHMGYGHRFHDDPDFPGGPHAWPRQLHQANTLIRKLHDHRYAGGLSWPEDVSSPPSTPTAPTARK